MNQTYCKSFQPINLCIVLYKIISKTIANRLQKVLELCIYEAQSAFVSGRLITHNVMLPMNFCTLLKTRDWEKKGLFGTKGV